MVKRGTGGGGTRLSGPENLRVMMERLLNLTKLLSPDTANPYDCLLDIRTMLHHKVQVEEVA